MNAQTAIPSDVAPPAAATEGQCRNIVTTAAKVAPYAIQYARQVKDCKARYPALAGKPPGVKSAEPAKPAINSQDVVKQPTPKDLTKPTPS